MEPPYRRAVVRDCLQELVGEVSVSAMYFNAANRHGGPHSQPRSRKGDVPLDLIHGQWAGRVFTPLKRDVSSAHVREASLLFKRR